MLNHNLFQRVSKKNNSFKKIIITKKLAIKKIYKRKTEIK